MSLAEDAAQALHHVAAALPAGGESRQGQVDMLHAVAEAIDNERHLIAQAGTGTGKSLAYLIPVILSGKKAVIATATKALQDQIATTELPHLRSQLERSFDWAVLKGRNNYICRQRVNEFSNDAQLSLAGTSAHDEDELDRLVEFSDTSSTGDRAELDFEPSDASWSAVSVTSKECPGRNRCPSGNNCFAEMARDRANEADVIVVNTHLLATDMRAEQGVLPEHDIIVIDEAHQLDDIATNSFGSSINGARMRWFARSADRILVDPEMIDKIRDVGDDITDALEPMLANGCRPMVSKTLPWHSIGLATGSTPRLRSCAMSQRAKTATPMLVGSEQNKQACPCSASSSKPRPSTRRASLGSSALAANPRCRLPRSMSLPCSARCWLRTAPRS